MFFLPGVDVSHVYLRAWALLRLLPQSYQYSNLSEGADRVGGQLRGDKEYPFSGVTNSGSLECGAGKCDARSVSAAMATAATASGRVGSDPLQHSAQHRFPAPYSKLCQIWLRHSRDTVYLRAAVHRRGQRPLEGLGTDTIRLEAT